MHIFLFQSQGIYTKAYAIELYPKVENKTAYIYIYMYIYIYIYI